MGTWDIVLIVSAGVIAFLAVFAVCLFLSLRKDKKQGIVFKETLTVSFLTQSDIHSWFARFGPDDTFCVCTSEALARFGSKNAQIPKNAIVQFVCKGEEIVASRIVRYDEIDGSLVALLEKGNGIYLIDKEEM